MRSNRIDIDILSQVAKGLCELKDQMVFVGGAVLSLYADPKGHSICSLHYRGIAVDIMPSDDGPIGPANRWYKLGFENLWNVKAGNEEIMILSAPCFIASKFEAFTDRGEDYRTSHDIEDIVFVLDNRTSIVQEVGDSTAKVRQFLSGEFKKLLENKSMEEILSVHLNPNTIDERFPILLEKVESIALM